MSETAFAQSFISSLASRPTKISPDHVEDARRYPGRSPYILPRMPKPMTKPNASAVLPGSERSVTLHLKSLRNPPLDIKLPAQPLTTSVLDIKNAVHKQTRIPVDKMKLLHNKRPIGDSKVLKEVVGDGASTLEFSVMVMGGAAAIPAAAEEKEGTPETADAGAEGATGRAVVETEEFWGDLKGFLMQRLKDQKEAEELSHLFKSSYESSRSKP